MLESKLGVLNGKNVGILGITYKADTSTVRRSPALKIINMLNQLGVNCKCYDPQADNKEILESGVKIERVNSINEAMVNSDALVLLTEWSEFRSFNFDDIYHIMKRPLIIDTKNYLDPNKLINFEYECFGKTFR
jgi:UDPglucose 6-dehydrogenase